MAKYEYESKRPRMVIKKLKVPKPSDESRTLKKKCLCCEKEAKIAIKLGLGSAKFKPQTWYFCQNCFEEMKKIIAYFNF